MKLFKALAQLVTEVIVEANSPTVLEARCRASRARPEIFSEGFDKEFAEQCEAISKHHNEMLAEHEEWKVRHAERVAAHDKRFKAMQERHERIVKEHEVQRQKTQEMLDSWGLNL